MTAKEEQYRDLVQRYYNASLDEIHDLADDIVAEDFVMHDPLMTEPIQGRDGLEEFHCEFEAAFSNVHLEAHDIIAEGDRVAVRFVISGTHDQGDFMGVEPTGTDITLSGTDINRFENGQFVETWSEYNAVGLMQQLGAMPSL